MPTTDTRPWHRQFWPWFLIALPASSVVTSFLLLSFALRAPDALVRADWSSHGYRINEDIERQREAAQRGIAARVELDNDGRLVTATLSGQIDATGPLALRLQHPTHAARDVALELVPAGENRFTATAAGRIDGTWDATLAATDDAWKIRRRIWLTAMQPAALVPPAKLSPQG